MLPSHPPTAYRNIGDSPRRTAARPAAAQRACDKRPYKIRPHLARPYSLGQHNNQTEGEEEEEGVMSSSSSSSKEKISAIKWRGAGRKRKVSTCLLLTFVQHLLLLILVLIFLNEGEVGDKTATITTMRGGAAGMEPPLIGCRSQTFCRASRITWSA